VLQQSNRVAPTMYELSQANEPPVQSDPSSVLCGHLWIWSNVPPPEAELADLISLLLKPVAREFQRSAVLRDCADDLTGGAIGHCHFDLQSHVDIGAYLAGQVGVDFVINAAGVSVNSCGVNDAELLYI
jgi:hypothetical protein